MPARTEIVNPETYRGNHALRIHSEYGWPRSSKPWYKNRQTDFEHAAHRSFSFSHLPSQPQRRVIVLLPFAGVIMETAIWQPRSEKNFIKGPAILRSPE